MDEELVYIYGLYLEGSNRIRYVGQSIHPSKRFTRHKTDAFTSGEDYPVSRWIRKYGRDRIRMKILDVVPESKADEAEIRWIQYFRNKDARILNIIGGGLNGKRRRCQISDEGRKRISETHKGRKFTPEHRRKISEARRGTKMTPQAYENHCRAHRSPEYLEKMRKICAARTPEEKAAIGAKRWATRRARAERNA